MQLFLFSVKLEFFWAGTKIRYQNFDGCDFTVAK